MKLSEIASLVDGDIEGNSDPEISGVGKIESAVSSEITFISNPLYEKFYATTNAGCVIVNRDFETPVQRSDISLLRVDDPYLSFIRLLEMFEKGNEEDDEGISNSAVIGENVDIGEHCLVSHNVVIGKNCSIGESTKIYSNVTIEPGVKIGSKCLIYPNVTIYKDCQIGNDCIIHSGVVIGSDGFGFAKNSDGSFKKILQSGNVVIGNRVEIGANTTIDRATLGSTVIADGVKIDNLVQIAHNVEIGENTAIASQAGIAGSAKIGKRCLIGGQAGIVGHLTICDDVIIGASVGVAKSITKPGIYTGYRAKPHSEDMRTEVRIRKLESLEERIKRLEEKTLTKK